MPRYIDADDAYEDMLTEKMQRLDACRVHFNKGIKMDTECKDCKHYDSCSAFGDGCRGCPMNYDSPFSAHHCHCFAYITRDELKQKRCKFYKPNEQEN